VAIPAVVDVAWRLGGNGATDVVDDAPDVLTPIEEGITVADLASDVVEYALVYDDTAPSVPIRVTYGAHIVVEGANVVERTDVVDVANVVVEGDVVVEISVTEKCAVVIVEGAVVVEKAAAVKDAGHIAVKAIVIEMAALIDGNGAVIVDCAVEVLKVIEGTAILYGTIAGDFESYSGRNI